MRSYTHTHTLFTHTQPIFYPDPYLLPWSAATPILSLGSPPLSAKRITYDHSRRIKVSLAGLKKKRLLSSMSYVGANRIIRKLRCAILARGKSALGASTPLQSGSRAGSGVQRLSRKSFVLRATRKFRVRAETLRVCRYCTHVNNGEFISFSAVHKTPPAPGGGESLGTHF